MRDVPDSDLILNLSQQDLDIFIQIVKLPSLINQLINQEQFALATKQICLYFQKSKLENCPKLLKLVYKEIIGVL